MEKFIKNFIKESNEILQDLPIHEIAKAINLLKATYERDGRIYAFGNGGSLSIATHWVSDFNKTIFSHNLEKHPRRFQAIRVPTTEEELTAWANDIGFNMVFAGPLKNYLREADAVVAISSSGNSENIIKAVKLAKSQNIPVIGLSGFNGGKLNKVADAKILVKTRKDRYDLVEGIHAVILHLITKYFQDCFDSKDSNKK